MVQGGSRQASERKPERNFWGTNQPKSGDVLGRYELIEVLGSGGMGTVYLARDPGLERKVAVKLLREPKQQPRLIREAKALARLAHPNVVAVYDVGTFEGRTFLAMELVDGMTVRQWLGAARRPWRAVLDVFVDAGRGLAAAHSAGLVHRDFKPDNVLVGNDGRARVVDFGLADEMRSKTTQTDREIRAIDLVEERLTQSGTVMGTPSYMAPEQFEEQPADERSDQFGFGIALWEALYGTRPFVASTIAGLIVELSSGRIAPPQDRRGVPLWLDRIVRRSLAPDPARRYPSMDALLADIAAELQNVETQRIGGGRYEPIEPAADGGRRRLLDRMSGQIVTLQPLQIFGKTDEREIRLQLSQEILRLAGLKHPHLSAPIDFGVDENGRAFFILDLKERTEDLFEGTRTMSVPLRRTLMLQLLGAVSYLHRHGIVHADLSPAHVRVTGGRAQLMILGSSELPASDPTWRAPEVRGGGAPSTASDLYSIAKICRKLLGTEGGVAVAVLDRAMSSNPALRYATVDALAAALKQAFGLTNTLDTIEARESFLQTARFVGRSAELARLGGALRSAVEGHGSAWLIRGEAGVGKSRLLDELGVLAISSGAIVVRGQEESEGASPYALWRGAIRSLLAITELNESELAALVPVVPESDVRRRAIPPPADTLEGPARQSRLVEAVLKVLRKQTRPIVLLLEDVHWSQSASLKLLQAVAPMLAHLPILLLATFRSEERPDIPEELAGFSRLELTRLTPSAIIELATSMLGAAGQRADLLALLQQETEGNALFLVEVVRALAEESGGIDRLAHEPLPAGALGGRMRDVLRRRLSRVPFDALPVLQLAAVTGRRIDPNILGTAIPQLDFERWAESCVQAAVLERREAELRFAHDKLREELLLGLNESERRDLHRQVLEAIEKAHSGATQWIASLAYHAHTAGDTLREARYAALAGEQALFQCADREATVFLERALELKDENTPRVERARLHVLAGTAYFHMMDFARSEAHLLAAGRAVNRALPATGGARTLAVLWELLVQIAHRYAPESFQVKSEARAAELIEAANAAARLSNIYIFGNDGVGVLGASLLAANASENAGSINALSMALLGFSAGSVGMPGAASRYFERMHRAESLPDQRRNLSSGAIAEASYYLGNAQFDAAEQSVHKNLDRSHRYGDRVNQSYCDYVLGMVSYYRGALDESRRRFRVAQERLEGSSARHAGTIFAGWEAFVLSTQGKQDEALELLSATRSMFTGYEKLPQAIWFGVLAMVHGRRGSADAAVEAAGEALERIPSSRLASPTAGGLIHGVVEAALAGAAAGTINASFLNRAEQYAVRWGKTHVIGRASALNYRGLIAQARGNLAQARQFWQSAVEQAAQRGVWLDESLGRFALANTSSDPSERESQLARAKERLSGESALAYLETTGTAAKPRRALVSSTT